MKACFLVICLLSFCLCFSIVSSASDNIKKPNVANKFYPADKTLLKKALEQFLTRANPPKIEGHIFAMIEPHAGYRFSGPTAAFGYKTIQGKPYKTVVVMGPAHFFGFKGISVYTQGKFQTPLGDIDIDSKFATKLVCPDKKSAFIPQAFDKEHSVEVQLPFLQEVLSDFRIVPVVIGSADLTTLKSFAANLVKAIAQRKDVLVVASSDLCHSYDYEKTEKTDAVTLAALQQMSGEELYAAIKKGTVQMCGGYPTVAAILASKIMGFNKVKILSATNSALVTKSKVKGQWTVGYAAAIITD